MSALKQIALVVASIAVLYFAPVLAPQIGTFLGASGFLATAIGSIVIAVGLTIVQSVFVNRPSGSSLEAGKVNVRMSEPLRWIDAGIERQGGGGLFGEFDSTGNFWYLIVHSDSIMTGTPIKYYLDDIEVTLDGDGNVTTNDFCLTNKREPYEGSGTRVSYVQIWTTTYSETDPTPGRIAALDATFPSKWTADHRLVGTTFSVIKMKALKIEDRYKIYKWRGPFGVGEPAIGLVANWSNMYDPRDPSQVLGDRTTYKPSRNNALVWAWFRTHPYGRKKPETSINWDMIAEQADICDQTVTGIGGSQPRYRCDTAIPEDKERSIAEQEILMSMDAQLVFDDDGKCWCRAGYYYEPTLKLTRNRDIVAMESVEAVNGESETQGVIVRYLDPAAGYTIQPSAPWYNPMYYVPGQAATFLTVTIPTIQNHNQAMRVAKSIGQRSQPPHKILPTVGLRGLRARQERISMLRYDNVFDGPYEIVTPVEVDPVGIFCGFGAVPIGPDRWTLLAGEEKPKPVIDGADVVYEVEAPTGVSVTVNNARVEATFAPPMRDDTTYEFQYILTPDIATDNWLYMTTDMINNFAYGGTVIEGADYSYRYRGVSASGRVTNWYPDPPGSVSAGYNLGPTILVNITPGTGSAIVRYRNPTSPSFDNTIIKRGATATYLDAADVSGPLPGGLGQELNFTDTVAAGLWYWWAVSRTADGTEGPLNGPMSATVA